MTDPTRTWQLIGQGDSCRTEALEVWRQVDPGRPDSAKLIGSLVRTIIGNGDGDREAVAAMCFVPGASRYDLTLQSPLEIANDWNSEDRGSE